MTDAVSPQAYDWGEVTGRFVQRLRAAKVEPVPDSIVKQAQLSWDGEEIDGEVRHVREHTFRTDEMAAEFARLIKKAGKHTTPETSVTAVIDPDNDGNLRKVSWRAGARRGKPTT